MRSPDQLASVLHDFSRHPEAGDFLDEPSGLETFLQTEAWPAKIQEWTALDSLEADELAQMGPIVETWLATLEDSQINNLKLAVEQACPGAREMLQTLLPIRLQL